MKYIAADDSRQRPIMIHRAIFGSLERFYGILIKLCRIFSSMASTDTGTLATCDLLPAKKSEVQSVSRIHKVIFNCYFLVLL